MLLEKDSIIERPPELYVNRVRLIQVADAVQAAECETLFEGDSNAVSTGTTCSFVLQAGRLAGRFTSRFAYGVLVQSREQNAAKHRPTVSGCPRADTVANLIADIVVDPVADPVVFLQF